MNISGADRRVAVSLSLPIKTYLKLAGQAEAAGQTLSLVINRLIDAGLEQKAKASSGNASSR